MGFTAVLVLPILVVIAAGVYYLYTEITRLMSKSAVRNKVVVITDAVSGMGKECSRVFHAGGARVILCGKSWEKLEALYDTLNSAADPSVTFTPKLVVLDFSDIDAIPDVTKEILECYGCVDVLISNTSMKVKAPVQNVSLEMDKRIMDTNYFGPITLTKGLLPSMISRRSGQLVLVNSIQGRLGVPFRTAYAASKHAAQAFFDCLRAEVEEFDISVSTISPTFIRSHHQQPEPRNAEKSTWKFFFRKFAHGVHPEEVANEVLRTVNRKKKEVLMANPIPRAALYIRSFLPGLFFAVVAAGVKDVPLVEEDTQ
ncbi:dehydrogenase/reductase SDR family member 7C-like [Acipenser oxyrinchus oxyrinchus]|uniref:Dehydrogenase/reductase SDR family member 7C n=1 Tax=Acipenser oxyrinchus oxyrinchus TaxID=40147 RepID=A0AAD8D427_ACIOX|nr:dehydrogenase/reductase SDR family member 7C-like [Acipenser oxyrinchus oxyrinchus]